MEYLHLIQNKLGLMEKDSDKFLFLNNCCSFILLDGQEPIFRAVGRDLTYLNMENIGWNWWITGITLSSKVLILKPWIETFSQLRCFVITISHRVNQIPSDH